MISKENLSKLLRGITILLGLGLCGYAVSDDPKYGGAPGFGASQAAILTLGVGLAASVILPKAWNARVLLVSVVALLCLGAAEIGAELILAPIHRTCFDEDEKLLFSLRPNCRRVYQRSPANGGERILHRVNSDGFRGEELLPQGSATKVIVYGDSFVHAAYSPGEDTLPEQLEIMLARRLGQDVEVINGGVSSFGPDQLSVKMEDDLPKLLPDLVVLAIFAGNDYGDLIRNKMFRLAEDGQLFSNDWVLDPEVSASFDLNRRESVLKRALRSVVRRFGETKSTYSWLNLDESKATDRDGAMVEFWLENAIREYQDFVVDGNNVVTNTLADHYSADISLLPNSESARYKVRFMNAVLTRVQSITREAGVPLVLLVIPHPMDVCENYPVGRVDRVRFPEYDRRNLTRPLEAWGRNSGVHVIGLFDAYEEQGACGLYFRAGNDHWNADGQKLAAEMVADYVLEHVPLPEPTDRTSGKRISR